MAPGMLIGFLAGLSAGAILGILYAPKKGEETRRELREKAMSARDKMQSQMAKRKEMMQQTVGEAADKAQEKAK